MAAPDRSDTAQRRSPDGMPRGYTPVQKLYLLRLRSLVTRRPQYAGRLEPGSWQLRLLDKALYSTYRDCVELGLADEARVLLRLIRQPQSS